MENNLKWITFEGGNDSDDIYEQFISSDYYRDNQLNINKFLDEDKTIDLEKLELAIILLIEYLEKSVKSGMPIYVNIGNMQEYILQRGLTNLDSIIEESSFILGFSQSIATENEIENKVIVRFRGKNYV